MGRDRNETKELDYSRPTLRLIFKSRRYLTNPEPWMRGEDEGREREGKEGEGEREGAAPRVFR